VQIISDARVAWRQAGCEGRLPPADPSFIKWSAYYKLPAGLRMMCAISSGLHPTVSASLGYVQNCGSSARSWRTRRSRCSRCLAACSLSPADSR
jgi:hypothetical protein